MLLTGPFAYKIKKALRLDFLDFSTLELRRHYCREELRLNRSLAPELYLDVVPIRSLDDRVSIGGEGRIIEYAVKMTQFPQDAQLDRQLDAGLLRISDMSNLAETIAGYHRRASRLEFPGNEEAMQRVRGPMLENFPLVRQLEHMDVLQRIHDWTERSLCELEPVLIERCRNGFVRECHGDLHLGNLVRMPGGIVAFDCVEFSTELRTIDVISDVAFLVMDLVARARQDLAYVFLNRYLECTGDYPGMDLLGLYFVYHCMIRAKVAAIRSAERDDESERRHDLDALRHDLAVAIRWIDPPAPRLVAMHGYSGSGKTWLSERLMPVLPAIRIRSDIERKRMLGIDETASSAARPGFGTYTERARSEVYETLLHRAERLLRAGYNVILDASFLRAADRQAVEALAREIGAAFAFVDSDAEHDELARRLQRRSASGVDASEADTQVLEYQYQNADPLSTTERRHTLTVSTATDVDVDNLVKKILHLVPLSPCGK